MPSNELKDIVIEDGISEEPLVSFDSTPEFLQLLEKWEKRLNLTLPNYLFRRDLGLACSWYLAARGGALACAARRRLAEERGQLRELREHLPDLIKHLTDERSHDVQAMLVRRVFIDDAPTNEQPDKLRRLFEIRSGLQELLDKASMQLVLLEKMRIPPNEQLGAERGHLE